MCVYKAINYLYNLSPYFGGPLVPSETVGADFNLISLISYVDGAGPQKELFYLDPITEIVPHQLKNR